MISKCKLTKVASFTASVLMSFVMTACGGGSSSSPQPQPSQVQPPATQAAPTTIYSSPPQPPPTTAVLGATLTDTARHTLLYVMRSDGTKIGIYGTNTSTAFNIAGYIYVAGDWWSSTDPTIYNGKDWGRNGLSVYVSASYDSTIPIVSGTIRSTSDTLSFSGGPIPGSSYDFNRPATLATIAGRWNMTAWHEISGKGNVESLDIAADGRVVGQYRGCNISGSATPSDSGKNLYSLRLSFDLATCRLWDVLDFPHDGFALAYELANGGTQLLIWAEISNGVDASYVLASGRR